MADLVQDRQHVEFYCKQKVLTNKKGLCRKSLEKWIWVSYKKT